MNSVKEIVKRPPPASMSEPKVPKKTGPLSVQGDAKKLTVGRDISLSGEITSCDTLIVEGEVRANLKNCRTMEIARSGTFRGESDIAVADIAGRFEGTLNVRDRLILRSTGRITGTVRYREIEIERGGKIAGTVELVGEPDYPENEKSESLTLA